MLVLPIKKKWFDMILSGEKLVEYREIKPYYTTRFINIGLINKDESLNKEVRKVVFRNGYSSNSPSFVADVSLDIGTGWYKWGGEPEKLYYRLMILRVSNINNNET